MIFKEFLAFSRKACFTHPADSEQVWHGSGAEKKGSLDKQRRERNPCSEKDAQAF